MKAQTAVQLLRASRTRMEEWGFLQLGSKEIIALEWAFQLTHNTNLKSLVLQSMTAIAETKKQKTAIIPAFGKAHFDAIREAYKKLELLPADKEFHIGAHDPEHMGEEVQEPTTEPAVSEDKQDSWKKELGWSAELEAELKDILKKDKQDGQNPPDTNDQDVA